ncbi:MAG: undecaprenyl-diphosphatase UppP [bacterium]|nr:undecaprenyl-diphosphatase UppP [bacterium]MDD5354209.1 undecaprenyl-diphosphatase UppP [bacterium]MDD5756631.1 undecaprenyl-diphosphatase UppP [bacterium]
MTILQAIIYGIIQGTGEFLPISSSGHLIAVPQLLGWADQGLEFDIALHWGTLVAVLIYFWHDWSLLFRGGIRGTGTRDGKMFWYLIAATIPGAIIGYWMDDVVESYFRNIGLVGISLIVMGMVLYLCDRYGSQKVNLQKINFWQSLGIGFSQALAIIPGVSRSGSTISCARILGLDRESAARFSFLLSTPIILGSAIIPLKKLYQSGLSVPLGYFVVGMLTAAIVGLLCIKFFLQYLKKADLVIFVWYRFVFGAILILFYFNR